MLVNDGLAVSMPTSPIDMRSGFARDPSSECASASGDMNRLRHPGGTTLTSEERI